MKNFSNKTINQIVNAMKDNMSDIKSMMAENADMPAEDVAQNILIQKYGLAQIEAEEIVEDLKKGISEFDSQMGSIRNGAENTVKKNLAKLSDGMNDDDRHDYYASILTAMQLLSSGKQDPESIEMTLEENKKLNIEDLISKIDQEMKTGVSLEAIGNSVKNDINKDVLAELSSKIAMNKDDFRLNAALWLYILQRDGKIKLTESEIGIPATNVGTMAAASIEAVLTTNELAQGNITLETWQVIMKWILGAVVFATLLVASVALVCYSSLVFLSLLLSVFGTSTLAVIISFVLVAIAAWGWSDALSDLQMGIMEWLSGIYDKYIPKVTAKVSALCEAVKALMHKAKEKVEEKVEETKEAIATTATADPEVQPVMA